MIWLESILGLGLVLLAGALTLILSLPALRKRKVVLRTIPALQRARRALGLSVEDGSRIHLSIGKASIFSPTNASALVGLSTLERVAQLSLVSDRPPVATSGEGTLTVLSQDTLQAAYRIANVPEQYDPERGRLTGATPMSYTAAALPVIHQERISANLFVGNFGPEVGLMASASEHENAFSLGASDALDAQSVLYVTAEETLIGEELFAVPAYLQAGSIYQTSLRVQDILRWVVIGLMVLSAILGLAGVSL
ncbi:DUF6754 domain-containing protein [Anaerolinea thermophila]|uniref:DUF6754 domain-containing protein n=1 Tax=Anaerolinea thermophila (strain DSM 14523 / JCM 11388 / NBRC 100420 / UNI-1) TaxID=926569 RepID=E8MYC4_ANATU|nr:DUF6754 domain-containing protein [Anaerolinea thermophila]BAJ62069.1 hypothetical protein ANT_00350 [Anaerolinea thermophila UNI-1]